jgi:transcriptional regulator with XRE-family HTH domain
MRVKMTGMDDTMAPTSQEQRLHDRVVKQIKSLMIWHDLTAVKLAELAGMKQAYLSRRMTGEILFDVEDLAAIAAALGIHPRELIPEGEPARAAAQQPRILTRSRRLTGSYPIATTTATPTQPDSHHIRPSGRAAGSPRSMSRVPAQTTASISRPARLSHPVTPALPAATSR